jgi:hypothetical protein
MSPTEWFSLRPAWAKGKHGAKRDGRDASTRGPASLASRVFRASPSSV